MQKILLITLLFFVFEITTNAQNVAINNDGSAAHPSAMLDVRHPNKGFLAPRVALTGTGDATTIPSPATALLVYNTTTAGTSPDDVTPGYYYYNGTAWMKFNTGSSGAGATNAWLLTGNAGTVDGTNFIGTTDNVPFNIRVNNVRAGRIDPNLLNTFFGYLSGNSNTTGFANTANGNQTLFSNTTGYYNTANGVRALFNNTIGDNNTANGFEALMSNTTGYYNTANGANALRLNTTGAANTANGREALRDNTTGVSNTANGATTLISNTTGNFNTANGVSALRSNSTGSFNTANGIGTLQNNTTGNFNTANGVQSLFNNTTGNNNTANGIGTLQNNTTGSNNTAIGNSANVASSDLSNATALGNGAMVNASNTVQIGNNAVTDIYFGDGSTSVLHAASVTPSDERFKYNIRKNIPGLDFITRLNPVTYNLDVNKILEFRKTGIISNSSFKNASYTGASQIYSGFMAQDVEKIMKDLGYAFDGLYTPKNEKEHYNLSYGQFVVPLVKAVQEQQEMIEELKMENEKMKTQEAEIKELKTQLAELTKTVKTLLNK